MLIITIGDGDHRLQLYQYGKREPKQFLPENGYLLIYQLEEHPRDYEELMEEMRQRYGIAGVLKDESGRILYQGHAVSLANADKQLADLQKQTIVQTPPNKERLGSTQQGGIYEVQGEFHEKYWGIPASIDSKEGSFSSAISYLQTEKPAGNNEKTSAVLSWSLACVFAGDCLPDKPCVKKSL